ncbi:MAG: sugar kinase [Myxococcales bacterium]|nr:sugar kinase [Myxococcales bacterium]
MSHAPFDLVVVGSVALDDLDGPFGPRPDLLGGSASYFSTAASYLAPRPVRLVAVVGEDFPEEHVAFLDERGVNLAGLERAPGKTFRWKGRYSDDLASRTTLDTQLGVFAGFTPRLPDAWRDSELVFLGNIEPGLQRAVVEQMHRPRLVACDTMNFWIEGKPESVRQTLAKVDLLVINDEEARLLSGEHNLVKAAAAVRRLGPHGVVVKRGDSGALLFHEAGIFAAPAFPLEDVVDPTGAGDSFAGGFMGYLARAGELSPSTLRCAMIYGSVMASFCVEALSLGRLGRLTLAEITARYRAFHELTHFENVSL